MQRLIAEGNGISLRCLYLNSATVTGLCIVRWFRWRKQNEIVSVSC